MKKRLIITLLVLYVGLITASAAFDKPKIDLKPVQTSLEKKEDVFLEADSMDYEQNSGVVVARGKVEVQKGTNVVFADQITYDQKQDLVTAEGNVSYIGPDGNTVFTDRVVLKSDLKEGVVNFFRARLTDGSLIAAAQGRRISDSKTELTKAVYSPCPTCNDPDSDPQWQIKAEKVLIDNEAQKVKYEDAYFEIYGVPVLYTPYFSHPTPNADRKSGFLSPSISTNANLGGAVRTPYYWNIAENMDATITPIITSKEGPVLAGDFRHLTNYGLYKISGSITKPLDEADFPGGGGSELRGHLKGEGKFDLTQHWDLGFDGEYSSDDSYLRRYRFDNTDLLTSRAYVERISDRNFTRLQAVHFSSLVAEDDPHATPLALPYLRSHIESNYGVLPGLAKSKLTLDSTAFNIDREIGSNSQRGSMRAAVAVPYISSGGHVFEAEASLRGDQFYLQNTGLKDTQESRVIPEFSLGWRLPMVGEFAGRKVLMEPIAKVIATPYKNYNKNIPNEDSQDIEFSELNVFDGNHYRGIDRVENGLRAEYGLRGGYYANDYTLDYVVGQNYRFKQPQDIPLNSGIEDNLSDYVGRIGGSYKNIADLTYRFRIDHNNYKFSREEIDFNANYYPVKYSLRYFKLDYDFTNPDNNRQEITSNVEVNLDKEWSVLAGGTRNLTEGRNVSTAIGLKYDGDCTNIQAAVTKEYITAGDAKSGTAFDIKIGLKNLGEI